MADLRDRYRRDYRSVPIPTPPRSSGTRGSFTGAPPNPTSPTRTTTSDTPLKPPVPTVTQQQTPSPHIAVPQPQPAPAPRTTPSEPPKQQTQAETAMPTKRQQKATKKAQKKAAKIQRKQQRKAQKSGNKARKLLLALVILVILGGLGVGGAYGYMHVKSLNIPTSYSKTSPFPVLYPVNLPNGYYVDTNSFNNQGDAFVFTIRNTSDAKKTVAVSEQVLPADFNPDHQLPDDNTQDEGQHGSYTTQVGKGQVGSFQGRQVATLASDKTWVIMNVSDIPSGDIAGIASSFERIRPLPYLSNKRLYLL